MPSLDLLSKAIRKSIVEGLNKTAFAARQQFFREISQAYGIGQNTLRAIASRSITVIKARESNLVVTVQAKARKLSLIFFQPKQEGPGASVEIIRGQRKLIPHAFIQRGIKSGRFNIFKRVAMPRYPISLEPGIPLTEPFRAVVGEVNKSAQRALGENITKAIQKAAK
jgi:hypothetical protein